MIRWAEARAQPVRHVAGLISGTSMDGFDVALCRITPAPELAFELVAFETVPLPAGLRRSLEAATGEQRRLRAELAAGVRGNDDGASLGLGIGGARTPARLKCLHAHAAFALARPGYVLGERILDELDPRWPSAGCCSEGLRG